MFSLTHPRPIPFRFPACSGSRKYSSGSSRSGVLSFEKFHSAIRALAQHMYGRKERPLDTFFERHIIPVALREGNKLVEQSDRRLVPGASKGMTTRQEIAEMQAAPVRKLLRANTAAIRFMYNAYNDPTAPGTGLHFQQVLLWAHDFDIVPRLLNHTQLLDMFAEVNLTGDDADDPVDLLSLQEFENLLALVALRFTPPVAGSVLPPSASRPASPHSAAVRSLRRLLLELDTHGGPQKTVDNTRGLGRFPPFVGLKP